MDTPFAYQLTDWRERLLGIVPMLDQAAAVAARHGLQVEDLTTVAAYTDGQLEQIQAARPPFDTGDKQPL